MFQLSLTAGASMIFPLFALFVAGGDHWTLFDDISATEKVYKCDGGTVPFYLYIKNASSDTIENKLCEGWNATSHTAIGYATPVHNIMCETTLYTINGDETMMIISGGDTANPNNNYFGYVNPVRAGDTRAILSASGFEHDVHYGLFDSSNTYNTWLYSETGQRGSVVKSTVSEQAQYSYNSDLATLYLQKFRLGDLNSGEQYRGWPKMLFDIGQDIPTGFALGDTIEYLGETYRLTTRKSNNSYMWLQVS